MNDKLSTWLVAELKQRGWSHRELARRAGVSQTAVSQAISEERNVGWDFCAAIAGPLGKTPEEVLRIAGLLPPLLGPGQSEDQLLAIYRQLSHQEQEFVLRMLHGIYGQLSPPPMRVIDPEVIRVLGLSLPGPEDVAEVAKCLSQPELQLLYDFAQWRLLEQEKYRNSSGKKREDEEAKQQERQQVINFINFYLAVNEATPEEREKFLLHLIEYYRRRHSDQSGDTIAPLSSINQMLPEE